MRFREVTGHVLDFLRREEAGDQYRCPDCHSVLTERDNSWIGEGGVRVWQCPHSKSAQHAFAVPCNADTVMLTEELVDVED